MYYLIKIGIKIYLTVYNRIIINNNCIFSCNTVYSSGPHYVARGASCGPLINLVKPSLKLNCTF